MPTLNDDLGIMKIDDLLEREVQQPLLDIWKNAGITTLTACQDRVLSYDPLWQNRNTLVVAPTSSGKTFVGEVLAAKSAWALKRAIFLVPYKAIAEEKYAEFRDRYGNLGISVVISDGDHTRFDRDIRRGDFGIAVIVYEKMTQLLIQSPGILVDCSLIVVDEIQQISDPSRGHTLEMLLTHLLRLPEGPQMVGLSATISDLGGLDVWLGADVVECLERPVPLWEGIASPNDSSQLENIETKESRPGPALASVVVPQHLSSPNGKLETAYRLLMAEGLSKQFLIFRTRVDDTIATARQLAYVLPADPVPAETRVRLADLESTRASDFLDQWIDKRVAYHNAGLSLEERRLIEGLFREGVIRVLVTTSTLAAGVNTPADIAIVLDYKRYVFEKKSSLPIEVAEYKNSVGRAGRFGMTTEGHSYIVADNTSELPLLRNHYLLGKTRKIRSSIPGFGESGILVLGLLSLGLVTSEPELRDAIRHSFAFNHYFDREEDSRAFLGQVMEGLADLQVNDLVKNDSDGLAITELGKVASASGMSLPSFYMLLEALKSPSLDATNVANLLPSLVQTSEFRGLRPYGIEEKQGALNDWISGTPTTQIIDKYSGQYELGSGNIRTVGERAAWMLSTAARIATVPDVLADDDSLQQALEDLAKRCKFGVPSKVVSIAELRVLHRSELNVLVNNSVGKVLSDPHEILDTPLQEFVGILSPQRAQELKAAILEQIGESLSNSRFGHVIRADRFPGLRSQVENCYDLKGIDFERALEELLNSEFLALGAVRFANQRTGQPDLELYGSRGTIVVQATASDDNKKPVSWDKARDVVTSVGYSGQASNYVTVARPGFHNVAVGNAQEIAARGDQRLLLVPLPDFIDLCLSEIEGMVPRGTLLNILEGSRGHLSADELLVS